MLQSITFLIKYNFLVNKILKNFIHFLFLNRNMQLLSFNYHISFLSKKLTECIFFLFVAEFFQFFLLLIAFMNLLI